MSRFLREPVTVRGAARTIVTATAVVVVASGFLMRLLDHHEYPNVFRGMWWALQTVTTVGYGDVTPQDTIGRVVAAVVMFEGIALLAIVTAAVTSSFVERAQHARQAKEDAAEKEEEERLDARFDDLAARLERVETMLRTLTSASARAAADGRLTEVRLGAREAAGRAGSRRARSGARRTPASSTGRRERLRRPGPGSRRSGSRCG